MVNKKRNKSLITPVVKWVGGKRQLLNDIMKYIPKHYNTYFEPFFGGGAVCFFIKPSNAVINDLNEDLITTYKVIKENVDDLISILKEYEEKNNEEFFYQIRDLDRDLDKYHALNRIEKAARLIYLNKTCFNGLFRVNNAGQFNTPYGKYKHPNIVNEETLKAVSEYLNLNKIEIIQGDFEESLRNVNKDDFVYLDPPYDPVSSTSSFTGYNEGGFDQEEQIRLKQICDKLNQKGVKFLLSNSNTEFIRTLYKDYKIVIVKAKRAINSKGSKRGEVEEVLVRNY